ncbi:MULTISPECIES: thioredoxin domain-containing protein [Amycolatopsis]|uniref:Thioredoxin domain-containing protein n=1 Tax=Amycolatopsis albidoflavus TaxID=102226 RepID=A0ABW5IHR2_9PSEU
MTAAVLGEAAAPEWTTSRWFNSDPLTLAGLRGRVVALEAFQMLCPGCVSHGLPQASRLARFFGDDLAVVGLHSVFEHHEAMTPTSLEAFLSEYKIRFPVGVDAHREGDPTPITFGRYGMRGTPSLVLIDRDGNLRGHYFGAVEDLELATAVTRLIDETPVDTAAPDAVCTVDGTCT